MNKLHFVDGEAVQDIAKRKAKLRAYAKEARAKEVNRDVKELLLNENLDKVYEQFFEESIGAGTRRTFFVYLSFSSEAPTDMLVKRLFEAGHRVFVPKVEAGEMAAVEIEENSIDFTRSPFGALEPMGQAYDGKIDVAVIPFLAVDTQGNRLGYGGGYYDKFLQKRACKRIAYGFDSQVQSHVPTQETDEKMHAIVTDKRVIIIQENA